MRDKLKDAKYWEEATADNDHTLKYLENSLKQKLADGSFRAAISANSLLMSRFQRCLLEYSKGAELEVISGEAIKLLCDWYPDYMASHPPGSKFAILPHSYSRLNRFFSILILSSPSAEASRFMECYHAWNDYDGPPVPEHVDHICIAMEGHLTSKKSVLTANGINWPDAYSALWKAISPETDNVDRASHLGDFLEDWYDKMSCEMAAQTGTHKQKNHNYVGYWCLEAAAASVMADIDDSGFRDHRYYPADWADWAREQRSL